MCPAGERRKKRLLRSLYLQAKADGSTISSAEASSVLLLQVHLELLLLLRIHLVGFALWNSVTLHTLQMATGIKATSDSKKV